MGVCQISVFLESEPGRMHSVLDLFNKECINVRGFSASDTGDYGIVRFIVDNPERALKLLGDTGAAAVMAEVLCLKLEDKPGELSRVMQILSLHNINVSYAYSLISTYIALRVDDVKNAEQLLCNEPVELVDQLDLIAIS